MTLGSGGQAGAVGGGGKLGSSHVAHDGSHRSGFGWGRRVPPVEDGPHVVGGEQVVVSGDLDDGAVGEPIPVDGGVLLDPVYRGVASAGALGCGVEQSGLVAHRTHPGCAISS